MTNKISKTNAQMEYLYSRLDEIQMNGHERLKAKARLAQAEAVADFIAAMLKGIGRLFRSTGKPSGRAAPLAG